MKGKNRICIYKNVLENQKKNSSLNQQGSPCSSAGKESAYNAGNPGSIPGLGRSPGEGNSIPLQYSCLEILMDRGAWQVIVRGVARVGHDLATKSPEEPGGLPSMGS